MEWQPLVPLPSLRTATGRNPVSGFHAHYPGGGGPGCLLLHSTCTRRTRFCLSTQTIPRAQLDDHLILYLFRMTCNSPQYITGVGHQYPRHSYGPEEFEGVVARLYPSYKTSLG